MRNLFFIFLFFCSFSVVFSTEKKSVVVYDTSKIDTVKRASAKKEKEVFADKDFIYHKEAKESKSWLEIFWEWLMNLLGKPVAKNPVESYKLIKYTFIGLFILGVVFILWKSKFIGLLRGDAKKLQSASFADLPEDIEGIDMDALIEDAFGKGNYRLAIRWCFLKSLQWLNKQNKITWQPAKTNVDYQHELNEKTIKENFTDLSKVFEYVWYGEVTPTEKLCTDYKNQVDKFISSANV